LKTTHLPRFPYETLTGKSSSFCKIHNKTLNSFSFTHSKFVYGFDKLNRLSATHLWLLWISNKLEAELFARA